MRPPDCSCQKLKVKPEFPFWEGLTILNKNSCNAFWSNCVYSCGPVVIVNRLTDCHPHVSIDSPLRLGRPLRRHARLLAGSWLQHLLYLVLRRRRQVGVDARRQLFTFQQQLHLAGVEHLALQQSLGYGDQLLAMLLQYLLGRVVGASHEALYFLVDLDGSLFAEVAVLGDLTAKEDLLFLLAKGKRAKVTHTPLAHHTACQLSSAFDVVTCASGHLVEEQLLGQASAHEDGDFRLQVVAGVVMAIAFRQLHGQAQRHAPRDDSHLVQRVRQGQQRRNQGVASLVVSRYLLLLLGQDHAATLGAHQHFVLGEFEVEHQHGLAVLPCSAQGSLVHHVGQVSAGEARRAASQHLQVNVLADGYLAGMYAQDLLPTTNIGQRDYDSPIKTSWPQQRGVKYVRTIRSGDEDDTFR